MIKSIISFFPNVSFQRMVFIVLLFYCNYSINAQKPNHSQIEEIDSLINVADRLYADGKDRELFIIVEKKIIPKSILINYDKGLCYGNFYIASCLSFFGNYLKSNAYIKKSRLYTSYLKKDSFQNSRIYGLIGDNLCDLKLYSAAIKNYHKSINLIKWMKDKTTESLLVQSRTYNTLAYLYCDIDLPDSAYYYLQKEQSILKEIPLDKAYIQRGNSYTGLGYYNIEKKNIDSAEYYFQKSLKILKPRNHPSEINALIGMGDVYAHRHMDSLAIDYYQQALDKSEAYDNLYWKRIIYKGLKKLYIRNLNTEEAKQIAILQAKFKDSMRSNIDRDRDFILNELMQNEKEEHYNLTKKKDYKRGLGVFLLIVVLLSIGFYLLRKRKKENDLKLNQKEQLIMQNARYATELEQKLQLSLEDVIEEARINSPLFFEKFQALYPDFHHRLLGLNKDLSCSDLILLAYVYLNLSSKEIASYTFRSYRTVQTRKYILRKKLGVKTNEDLYIWLKNIY